MVARTVRLLSSLTQRQIAVTQYSSLNAALVPIMSTGQVEQCSIELSIAEGEQLLIELCARFNELNVSLRHRRQRSVAGVDAGVGSRAE